MNIKEDIIKLVDYRYKEFHSKLCPGINNILGVRVPVLRNYAKEIRKDSSLEKLLKIIYDEYYEEIMLQGMLIGLEKDISFEKLEEYIKLFVPKINNWAICDNFCAGLKITKKYKKEMYELINEYLKYNNEFAVRFAIVMILNYYIEKDYLKENFAIFDKIKLDKYYVKMAVSWSISICLIKYYEETYKYLKNNKNLDLWTYNKSIQKATESYRITDEQKQELVKIKRK